MKNVKELIAYSPGGVVSKTVSKTGSMDVSLFCMAAGTEISSHTSTREGIVFVLEGKGVFVLQGKEIKMKPGVLIFMEKNAVHSLAAEEDTSFLLFLSA